MGMNETVPFPDPRGTAGTAAETVVLAPAADEPPTAAVPEIKTHTVTPFSQRAPGASAARPPMRLALTVLHLAAYGVVGVMTLAAFASLLGLGLGLALLLGIGLVILVGLVYAMYGVAWFEMQRVDGLYDLGLAPLTLVQRRGVGFTPWLGQLCRQVIDGRMWRSLANFIIASLMGAILLFFVQVIVRRGFAMAAPMVSPGAAEGVSLWSSFGLSLLAIISSLGAIVGLALLHRTISIALIRSGAREEELAEQVAETTSQKAGAVRAADVERTRIERDLHDGVQPRLVSVGMTLGLAHQKIDTDPETAKELVAEAHTSTKAAITELRQLARGIYASVLDDRGLDAALSAVAARSHIPVRLDVRITGRCSREAEAAVYFAIAESLTNAAKHSRASECRVTVRQRDEGAVLWARVEDNGIGGARTVPGGGLDGITNRVLAAGGTTSLDSPQGGPTALEVSVPCAF